MFEKVRIEKPVKFTSGKTSNVFYDFDLLNFVEVEDLCWKILRNSNLPFHDDIKFLATQAIGGVVPGFMMSGLTGLPLVIVDKDGLARGWKSEFVDKNYIIIDDVVSTYKAVDNIMEALPNCKCKGIAAYMFRGDTERLNPPLYFLSRGELEV